MIFSRILCDAESVWFVLFGFEESNDHHHSDQSPCASHISIYTNKAPYKSLMCSGSYINKNPVHTLEMYGKIRKLTNANTVNSLYLELAKDYKICSRQREFEIEREKQLQPTQRDQDFSSRQREVRDTGCSRQRESTVSIIQYLIRCMGRSRQWKIFTIKWKQFKMGKLSLLRELPESRLKI